MHQEVLHSPYELKLFSCTETVWNHSNNSKSTFFPKDGDASDCKVFCKPDIWSGLLWEFKKGYPKKKKKKLNECFN